MVSQHEFDSAFPLLEGLQKMRYLDAVNDMIVQHNKGGSQIKQKNTYMYLCTCKYIYCKLPSLQIAMNHDTKCHMCRLFAPKSDYYNALLKYVQVMNFILKLIFNFFLYVFQPY